MVLRTGLQIVFGIKSLIILVVYRACGNRALASSRWVSGCVSCLKFAWGTKASWGPTNTLEY